MKTPIAVTLIIMGALLVGIPALSDYLYQRNLVALLAARPDMSLVNLDGKMGDLYRIGCWLTGSIMVGVTVLCSLFVRRPASEHERLATTQAA